MSNATVVFSDGSKKMAHNLDDSRFRWYERKLHKVEQIKALHHEGIIIRDCSRPSSIEQAHEWLVEIKNVQTALSQQIQVYKARADGYYKSNGQNLRVGLLETNAQLSALNEYIRNHNKRTKAVDLSPASAETQVSASSYKTQLIKAQAEIIRLQRLLIEQFNLPADVVINENYDYSDEGGAT